jgi:hypothetical protein
MLDELMTLALAMAPENEQQAFFNKAAELTGKVPQFKPKQYQNGIVLSGDETREVEEADYDQDGNIIMERLFL